MSEAHSETLRRREPAAAFDLKKRLEQLARGECSAEDFVRESLAGRSRTDGPWDLLSFIDQRYRLGQIPDELFQSIKSRIAWNELQDNTFGTTVELVPIAPATPAAPASARSAAPSPANVPAARIVVRGAADSVAAPVVLELQDAQVLAGPSLASAPALVEALRPGRVLCDRYVIENCLGDGGMGTVYRAIDRHAALPAAANRRVALKVLRERLGPRPAVLVQLRRDDGNTLLPVRAAGRIWMLRLLGNGPANPRAAALVPQLDGMCLLTLATVTADGWPYMQHRGGPAGFLVPRSPRELVFADYGGNRQLITVGSLAKNARVCLFLMDYAGRSRLKILGHATVLDAREHQELVEASAPPDGHAATVERIVRIEVKAFDWNCPKFITPRYTEAEVQAIVRPLQELVERQRAELERR